MNASATALAIGKAEKFLAQRSITALPVNPFNIAESLGIAVEAKPATAAGVSAMLLRHGDSFGILFATHVESEGFQRFSVAHEIGHFCLEGHVDHIFPPGTTIHSSHAGFVSPDQYEREADYFAVGLLMPDPMFKSALVGQEDGLAAIEAMAELCKTSLTATAIRYIEKTAVPAAIVMSTGRYIDYCFMSKELQDFPGLTWPKKGQLLPDGVYTSVFNDDAKNIRSGQKATEETTLTRWFASPNRIAATEEVIGLGSYGKTLTVISAETFANEISDTDDDAEESYTPRFRR